MRVATFTKGTIVLCYSPLYILFVHTGEHNHVLCLLLMLTLYKEVVSDVFNIFETTTWGGGNFYAFALVGWLDCVLGKVAEKHICQLQICKCHFAPIVHKVLSGFVSDKQTANFVLETVFVYSQGL